MKHLLLSLLLSFVFFTNASAQRFSVFAIKGVAYTVKENKQHELSLGEIVDPNASIIIPSKSSILLLDSKKKKKLPQILGPQNGPLNTIIKSKEGVGFIKCISEVFKYIVGKNSTDFGTVSENGHFMINASTQRSLSSPNDNNTLNELDKGVVQIMEQFYKGSEE